LPLPTPEFYKIRAFFAKYLSEIVINSKKITIFALQNADEWSGTVDLHDAIG
jgi:HKD family nuclease